MWPERGLVVEFIGDHTAENVRLAKTIKARLTQSPAHVYGGRSPRVRTSSESREDLPKTAGMLLARLFLSPSGCRDSIAPLIASDQSNPLRSLRYLGGMLAAIEETRRARRQQAIHLADRGLFQILWRMHRSGREPTTEWATVLANLHYPIFDPDVVVCLSRQDDSLGTVSPRGFVSRISDALGTEMQIVTIDDLDTDSVRECTDRILAAWGGESVRAEWVESATLQGPYREKVWWG